MISCLVLFYISTKYHKNIPKGLCLTKGPVLHFCQVPSKYSKEYSSYRADEKSISNKTKGDNSKSKKAILVRDMSSGPVLHFYQVSEKYSKGSLTYRVDTISMDNHCQI